ncbi:hypothetical protein Tco_0529688 [Tanacetum coccineum]
MNPRSCLWWKPTGRIFSNVRLRWIPTGKLLNSCTGKVDSETSAGSSVGYPSYFRHANKLGLSAGYVIQWSSNKGIGHNADALTMKSRKYQFSLVLYHGVCENKHFRPRSSMFKWRLNTVVQASVFMAMMSVYISSGLVLHQMTFDHNRSELGIHDHNNEPSSSSWFQKVGPLAVRQLQSRQELEFFSTSY